MKRIIKDIYILLLKFLPRKYHDRFILVTISTLKQIDILEYAYNSIGILKWENEIISGELGVLEKVLPKYLNGTVILFDIGANQGNYSVLLKKQFPNARIFSFEPNPYAFRLLENNLKGTNINLYNMGFGIKNSREKIYVYKNNRNSEHASLYNDYAKVISKELGQEEVIPIDIEIRTIDNFCDEVGIGGIDFIKIDVEGHEFSVLQGAIKMIHQNKIKIIQFEFNVANILSRVFLKDFYDLLGNQFILYRLDSDRLIELGSYDSKNEIFKFQNLLAINKTILHD